VPVLLLAQGDPPARELLKKAIEARYALRPPVLESLRIDFKGRSRAKIGPISSWVPVETSAQFLFPRAMRWDFKVTAAGVRLGSGSEAFDGTTSRTTRGSKAPVVISDPAAVESLHRRLWAIAAVFLTPLGDHFVKLRAVGDLQLDATNTQTNSTVRLTVRPNKTLESVEVTCLNPDSEREQRFSLHLSEEQAAVNDLILPTQISAFWDDAPSFEIEPILAQENPTIAEGVFSLQAD
jgi:hypothetical protein